MTYKKSIGDWGESLAVTHLIKNGHQILEQNYRHSYAEVDIISMKDEVLTFTEVKTRSLDGILKAEETLSDEQIERIQYVASYYMDKIDHEWIISIDFICIDYRDRDHYSLTHFANIDINNEFRIY